MGKLGLVILAGLFGMGGVVAFGINAPDPPQNAPEFVQYQAEGSHAFAISKAEVSVAQWRECERDGACPEIRLPSHTMPDHPMTRVSYYDSLAYVNWLAERTRQDIRLPTRHEWLLVAADHKPRKKAKLFDDPNLAWAADYDLTAEPRSLVTSQAGSFGENSLGLVDISGNVWEWTATCLSGGDHQACMDGRIAMGEHEATLSSLVRDPSKAGCGGGQPPSLLGFRVAIDA